MKTIRGGNGLGDALYVQSIARHLVKKGQRLEVCTSWPDVFKPLGDDVVIAPFRRPGVDIVAHYVKRKQERGTTQFEDCCISAGIDEPVELRLDWAPEKQYSFKKPLVLVALPRHPMNRKDGFGDELMPDCSVIQRAIDKMKGRACLVQVGVGEPLHRFTGLDLDLANKTTVSDLLDIASAADGFLGYCSFFIPMAESFAKPLLCVWSSRGLRSSTMFIRTARPVKLLHRETSQYVMDDCSQECLTAAVNEFLEQIANGGKIYREVGGDSRERAGIAG